MRQAQVVQRRRQQFRAVVEDRHAALLQLFHVLGLEDQVPGVHRRVVAQHRFDLGDVVADAGAAPQVREAVFVARVVGLQRLEQHRIEVLPVRQLALVEFLQRAALNLPGHEVVGRKHHVVTGFAGHQLAVEGFVAVVDVVGDADAGFFLEVLGGVRRDVVGPVVDLDRFGCLARETASISGARARVLRIMDRFLCGFSVLLAGNQRIKTIRKSARRSCARFPGYPRYRALLAGNISASPPCMCRVSPPPSGVKVQRPGNEVAELLGGDLPTPAPGRAFPDAGFDAVVALDAGGRGHRDRFAEGHGHRVGLIQLQGCGVFKLGNAHGVTCLVLK